jgi:hypothetical protein
MSAGWLGRDRESAISAMSETLHMLDLNAQTMQRGAASIATMFLVQERYGEQIMGDLGDESGLC